MLQSQLDRAERNSSDIDKGTVLKMQWKITTQPQAKSKGHEGKNSIAFIEMLNNTYFGEYD